MPPSRDDFARWRDDHVTRWVFRGLEAEAANQKAEWDGISWGNGKANQAALDELRTRADAYRAMAETTYEGFCEVLGETPSDD